MNRSILPALAICAAAVVFFFPVLAGHGTFLAFDILGDYLPWSATGGFGEPRNPIILDPLVAFYPPLFFPAQTYFKQVLSTGHLPLWYDANFCGTPFILFTSPVSFALFSVFPVTVAHDVLLFLHLAGAGLLGFAYLRKIGLRRLSAAIGGIAWMFNGYGMVWFEFEHVPMLAAALPAGLLSMEIWFEKRSATAFLGMAVAFALTWSVSYAHLIIFQILFFGVYFLALLFRHRRPDPQPSGTAVGFSAGTAVALALSMVVAANFFTSHFMLLREGQRPTYGYEEIFQVAGRLQSERLSTLVFPDLFGNPVDGVDPTPRRAEVRLYNNYNELCIYPGVFCLLLALAGAVQIGRRRGAAFFLASALATAAMALGTLLYYPLWRYVPGMNLSTPTRVLYLFGFAVSMLAAVGADALLEAERRRTATTAGLFVLTTIGAVALAAFLQTDDGVLWASAVEGMPAPAHLIPHLKPYYALTERAVGRPLILTAASAALLFAVLAVREDRARSWLMGAGALLLFIDLAGFGLYYNTVSPRRMAFPETPGITFLKQDPSRFRIMTSPRFVFQGFVPFQIDDIGGYASVYPKRYGEFIHLSQHGLQAELPERMERWMPLNQVGSPLLDIIDTKYILAPKDQQPDLPGYPLVYDGEIKIYENPHAFDRAFFVARHRAAKNRQEALALLRTFSRRDFAESVILETDATHQAPADPEGPPPQAKIRVISWQSNRIVLEVDSTGSGFVVVGDNYYPGWKARVDGREATLFRANYTLRAVAVKMGRHRVEMAFRPPLVLAGLYTTLGGWPLLLACWLAAGIRKRKKPADGLGL